MAEVNRRKQIDAGFASFVRKNLEREMADGGVADGVTRVGEANLLPRPDQDLVVFAPKYGKEPSDNLRPKGGFVTLAGEQIPYNTFIHMVNKATAARLL